MVMGTFGTFGKSIRRYVSRRIVGQIVIDILLVVASNAAAFALKYDPSGRVNPRNLVIVAGALPVLIALRLLSLWSFRLYRIHWRYLSIRDLWVIVGATTASSLGFFGYLVFSGRGGRGEYSWGMQVLDWIFNIVLLSGVRVCYRQLSEHSLLAVPMGVAAIAPVGRKTGQSAPLPESAVIGGDTEEMPAITGAARQRQRALIVGAGDAGETIARELLRRPQEGVLPIGFVDDDPQKRNARIHGIPVLGATAEIGQIAQAQGVELILIAIPNAPGRVLRDLFSRCEKTQARLCIVPSLGEALDGTPRPPGRLRDIRIEDLLGREPVRTDMEGIARYISGENVLVTGAGGSIGSELCRQIAPLRPARLILVGQGENSVFEIEQELIRELDFVPVARIADVKDRVRMEEIFRREQPTVVFHAAAHKHVPLMEANPQEAVKNNVLGTRNVAELAAAHGVRKFIYVSTDKAVNPSSVMGATKRIGEMIVQSLAKTTNTQYAAVRFGNVLGSRGSVIPTMRRQIARGGPVTVTDARMTRYFMTIPEAVQLILQAGMIGGKGEVFLLDMGEPVHILDLARDLIRLSGYRPDVDVKIEFTGARPGEKIVEELLYDEENAQKTSHEKIYVSTKNGIDPAAVLRDVERLIRIAREGASEDSLRADILCVARSGFHPAQSEFALSPGGQHSSAAGNGNGAVTVAAAATSNDIPFQGISAS